MENQMITQKINRYLFEKDVLCIIFSEEDQYDEYWAAADEITNTILRDGVATPESINSIFDDLYGAEVDDLAELDAIAEHINGLELS